MEAQERDGLLTLRYQIQSRGGKQNITRGSCYSLYASWGIQELHLEEAGHQHSLWLIVILGSPTLLLVHWFRTEAKLHCLQQRNKSMHGICEPVCSPRH